MTSGALGNTGSQCVSQSSIEFIMHWPHHSSHCYSHLELHQRIRKQKKKSKKNRASRGFNKGVLLDLFVCWNTKSSCRGHPEGQDVLETTICGLTIIPSAPAMCCRQVQLWHLLQVLPLLHLLPQLRPRRRSQQMRHPRGSRAAQSMKR